MTKHSVTDDGDLRKYFAAIPNVVCQLGLGPYELALYVHFKQAAGDDGGVCWKSRATIARESGMSAGMVTKARAALERPRPELGGKSLITVKEGPTKTGGKPTCAIRITDIWALNMSRFSTSPRDIATSPHDVDRVTPSPHDRAPSYSDGATSPHDHKEKPYKKNPEENKDRAHARLMDFIRQRNGPIANGGKEGKAVKWILTHYTPDQAEGCFDYLAAQAWRTTAVSWATVEKEIGPYVAKHTKPDPAMVAERRRQKEMEIAQRRGWAYDG